MKNIFSLISNPKRVIVGLLHRFGRLIPDKIFLHILFRAEMGYWMDWNNPKTFNEKLQWLKIYNRKSEYTRLVDKIEVKKWVKEKIGDEYIIPTYSEWKDPFVITDSDLPEKFVLKCNHSGGNTSVFVVKDKNNFNLKGAIQSLKETLRHSVYDNFKEWPYKDVSRRVMCEMLLETNNGEDLADYKFFCYNGFVESVMICIERDTGSPKFYFFDKDWTLKRYNKIGKEAPAGFSLPRPENLDRMFEIASTLSQGIPFVRVDLYNVDGKIYFGEMTFYSASGLDADLLPETDNLFGSLIQLPK